MPNEEKGGHPIYGFFQSVCVRLYARVCEAAVASLRWQHTFLSSPSARSGWHGEHARKGRLADRSLLEDSFDGLLKTS
jgi:hypothetical protein